MFEALITNHYFTNHYYFRKRKKTTLRPCVLYWGNERLEYCLILLGGKLFKNKDKYGN